MKIPTNYFRLLLAILLFTSLGAMAQTSTDKSQTNKSTTMKTYLIEREIPNAGKLTPAELKAISQTSCSVLKEMGPRIQWIHSYVTGNKIFCIYKAENPELIREHAKKGGFPANTITEISSTISPATAN
ncbi:MAG TPA: DUF4242 domain-containing protein [Chitinophagaceae bacterium]|nr:DUF4242 domain-containing protein [Chitinophagaceae bacterium]